MPWQICSIRSLLSLHERIPGRPSELRQCHLPLSRIFPDRAYPVQIRFAPLSEVYRTNSHHIILIADGTALHRLSVYNFYFFHAIHSGRYLKAAETEDGKEKAVAAHRKIQCTMVCRKFASRSREGNLHHPRKTMDISGEFARIDDPFVTKYYKNFFFLSVTAPNSTISRKCGLPMFRLFNSQPNESGEKDA